MKSRGFTLVELIVTLSVLVICTTIVIPNMTFIYRIQAESAAHEFLNAVKSARVEASRSFANGPYTICPSSGSDMLCTGSWSDGFIVFNDQDASGSRGAGERVAMVQPAFGNINVTSKSTLPYVLFATNGMLHGQELGARFTFKHARYPSEANTFHVCVLRGEIYVVDDKKLNSDNRFTRCQQIQ